MDKNCCATNVVAMTLLNIFPGNTEEVPGNNLLQEDGEEILLEDGSAIELE